VLDIGAGNGALLCQFGARLGQSAGVDRSTAMINLAKQHAAALGNLEFHAISGPTLPFADASFDVVVSLLSFRYLDWDPMMNEIRRVLAPGGRILIVDMVTVPARLTELPAVLRGKAAQVALHLRKPAFASALRTLVADPRFRTMLAYNPIRAEHELRWYLQSRFPGRHVETLDIAHDTRVLAFDSGPLQPGWVPQQSYP
jgi:ubiquinone/menaquinone biosynthesis C-methylase UbiE